MAETDLFGLAERRLAWLDKRQGLLAQNIANADTPHYQPRDLKPFTLQLERAQVRMAPVQTSPLHLAGVEVDAADARATEGEQAISGNQVQIERELTKVANTDASQELVSELYKKYLGLYRTAIGR
jgi:flagellar basal-body rod protein FlgB